MEQAQENLVELGRRPKRDKNDVFSKCAELVARGVQPSSITGYMIQKEFDGVGHSGRYKQMIEEWRRENRYDEPVTSSYRKSASKHTEASSSTNPLAPTVEVIAQTLTQLGEDIQQRQKQEVSKLNEDHGEQMTQAAQELDELETQAQDVIQINQDKVEKLERDLKIANERIVELTGLIGKLEGAVSSELKEKETLQGMIDKLQGELIDYGKLKQEFETVRNENKTLDSKVETLDEDNKKHLITIGGLKDDLIKLAGADKQLEASEAHNKTLLENFDKERTTLSTNLERAQENLVTHQSQTEQQIKELKQSYDNTVESLKITIKEMKTNHDRIVGELEKRLAPEEQSGEE